MQITKNRLKKIIKEELKDFLVNEEAQLSPQGNDALEKLMQVEDPSEIDRIYQMIKAGQSL